MLEQKERNMRHARVEPDKLEPMQRRGRIWTLTGHVDGAFIEVALRRRTTAGTLKSAAGFVQ